MSEATAGRERREGFGAVRISVKAGRVLARHTIDAGEIAGDEHVAIGLQHQRRHGALQILAGNETAIESAIGAEARDVM